jgi:hypothetical protein
MLTGASTRNLRCLDHNSYEKIDTFLFLSGLIIGSLKLPKMDAKAKLKDKPQDLKSASALI